MAGGGEWEGLQFDCLLTLDAAHQRGHVTSLHTDAALTLPAHSPSQTCKRCLTMFRIESTIFVSPILFIT